MSIPFWKPPSVRYTGSLPAAADVLVIGGGITGVSLLHHLGRRGVPAVLVERSHLAAGASGRNAGFLLAGVADNYAHAVLTFGREQARSIWALTLENHERQIEARHEPEKARPQKPAPHPPEDHRHQQRKADDEHPPCCDRCPGTGGGHGDDVSQDASEDGTYRAERGPSECISGVLVPNGKPGHCNLLE